MRLYTSTKALLKAFMVLGIALLLPGCAGINLNPLEWFGSDEEANPPNDLMDIAAEVSLDRLWSIDVGNGQGDNYTEITPAISDSVIFAASENGVVMAVTLDSGDVIWRSRLDERPITGGVGVGGGLVVVGSRDAEVIALDQSNGEKVWISQVTSEVVAQPIVNDDIVVVQTVDDKVTALDNFTGEQRWIYESTQPPLTLRGTSRPVFTPADTVIAGFSNGTLVSVSADDGVWRWEERVAIPEGRYDIDRVIDIDGDLVVDGNRIFASSYQGNLIALDVVTGRIVWGLQDASSYHGITQGFGNLYYSNDESHVVAVRDESEDIVWQNEDLQHRSITAPTAISNFIAVADFEGYVHLISQIDGRIVGRTKVDDDGVRANLLTDLGRLIIFGNSGTLAAFSLQ